MQDHNGLTIAALIGELPVEVHDRVDAAESILRELERRIAVILHGPVKDSPPDHLQSP